MIAEFGLAQGLSQVAGMLCGLIYVRFMTVDEYAIYALCLSALGLAAVGSDLGLTGSLNYFWRDGMQTGHPIGPKIAAVRKLRLVLLAVALTISATLLLTSTSKQAVSSVPLLLSLGLVAITALLQSRSGVEIQVMRLDGRQRQSYYCESAGSLIRLMGAVAMIVAGIGTAWFGLTGGVLGAIATYCFAQRFRADSAREHHPVRAEDWLAIRRYLLPLAPSVAVFMIQEPLVYWFAATRGGAVPVAEVFALGRIGALYGLVGTFTHMVLTPRLARINDNAQFLRVCGLCLSVLCVASAGVLAVAWFVPQLLLLLIGQSYAHLQTELIVAMATATAANLTAFLILTGRVRGWVAIDPYMAIYQITAIAVLCSLWKFDSTIAVLELNLWLAFSSLICAAATFTLGLARPELVTPARETAGQAAESRPMEPH